MHRQPRLTRAQCFVGVYRQDQTAAPTAQPHQIAALEASATQIIRMQAEYRLRCVAKQPGGGAGTAHAVPLITQATSIEEQRIVGVALFFRSTVRLGDKARATISGGKTSVEVQTRSALMGARRKWPLLRAQLFQHGMIEAGIVQVAPCSQALVFLEQRFGAGKVEQARLAGT